MRFTALKQFEWRDEKGKLIAQYVPGLSYTVRPGNDKLAAKIPEWIEEGKVVLGGPAAELEGRG